MGDSVNLTQNSFAQFCSGCGQKLQRGTKFCGGCGLALAGAALGNGENAPYADPEDTAEIRAGDKNLTIGQGWLYYFGGLGIFVLLTWLIPGAGVILYFAMGVFMSRYVMRHLVEWHPNFNTLHNVVSEKIWMVLLWPLRMLILLFKLSANHVL